MARKILILCIDGLGPAYLEASPTPNIDEMARLGSLTIGHAVIPSVTNVNNVSIVTGAPPARHGITANYTYDPHTGVETYMESAEYLTHPTIIQRAQGLGLSTAVLTAKRKLLALVGAGADYVSCAEQPDPQMVAQVGAPGDIYAADINVWLLRALRRVLRDRDPDLVYCATTDGMMHKYAPYQEPSLRHVQALDAVLGQILMDEPTREIYLTADHGMEAKRVGLDLSKILAAQGIAARAIPIIKDRYVAHHGNLGGACYVYLQDMDQREKAMGILQATEGVEVVYTREEAAEGLQLMASRIGDLLALGNRRSVFGTFDAPRTAVQLRSHGSRHESAVPILAYGGDPEARYRYNYDLVAQLGLGPSGGAGETGDRSG
jgi:phosphonoacetate hydrolase